MRSENPLGGYVTHGVKVIGDYTYILLIGIYGDIVLIKRIKSDLSEILFSRINPEGLPDNEDIPAFWADPTVHEYKYFHLI